MTRKFPFCGLLKRGNDARRYISAAGEDLASEPSDTTSDGPTSRHHLLRHKLTLDEGTSSDKAEAESEVGKQESKQRAGRKHLSCKNTSNIRNRSVWRRGACFALMSDFDFCQADSESDGDTDKSELEDLEMSEELSQSEDEASEDEVKRYIYFSCHW